MIRTRSGDGTGGLVARLRGLPGPLWRVVSDRTGALHLGMGEATGVTLICVYRRRNAATVATLVDSLPHGSQVLLHALDGVAIELQPWTVGTGPGMRMDLLSRLLTSRSANEGPLLIADDDVAFVHRQGLRRFAALCQGGRLDIAMPAHHESSAHTFTVTRRKPWRTARLTSFVEVGPLVWLSAQAQRRVIPFPANSGMGWGVDVWWSTLAIGVLRLGVVDATPVRHLAPVGADYALGDEKAQVERMSRAAGVDSAYDLAHDLGPVWRPWRARPPW